MAGKILMSILCLTGSIVASQNVDVNGNCSSDLQSRPEPFTVTGVERPPLNCDLWETSSCRNGNLPAQVGGPFMGPPSWLHLEAVLFPYNDRLYPKLIVNWKPPNSAAGIHELKGFYMVFTKVTGPSNMPDTICRVFDFSQNNFTTGDHNLKFTKTFVQFMGGPLYLYILDLYTLPYSRESESKRQFFTLQSSQSKNNTANWNTSMIYNVENATAPAQISVRFSLAPTYFNFKKYKLQLVSSEDNKNAYITCYVSVDENYQCQGRMYNHPDPDDTTVKHTFLDVEAGSYNIWVQPEDPYWQEESRCLCFESVINGDRVCQRCITTKLSREFVVDGEISPPATSPPTSPSTSAPTPTSNKPTVADTNESPDNGRVEEVKPAPPTEDNVTLIVASILGSVLGVVLVAIAGICFWKQRKKGEITLPFFKQNNKGNTTLDLPKKKICFVYTSDHKDHVNAINKFARYLSDHCACQVFFMPWFQLETRTVGCYEWILRHIDISDYVIIINSEAAFKLYEARNSNTSFKMEDKGPQEDMFSVAISHVMARSNQSNFYKKNILAYFEYTSEDFLLKDLAPGLQYKLTKHLKELLCHIHEVETHGLDVRQFTIDSFADVAAKPEGRSLLEAITKAKHFQKSNPFWFAKNFHRQDSAYDSSSSPDLEQEPDSVSTGPRFTFPNDDESKSTVTCNTAYLKHHQNEPEAMSTVTYNTHYQNMHPETGFSPIAPSTVVTTTAPTEVIDDQIAKINYLGTGNPYYNFPGESSSDDFSPPSDVPDDDLDMQFININKQMDPTAFCNIDPTTYNNLHTVHENRDLANEIMDPRRNMNRRKNIPEDLCDDNGSDISEGRDV